MEQLIARFHHASREPAVAFGGFMPGFGTWLKRQRAAAELTLEELAEMLGTSHPTISRYENDKSNPKRPTVIRIAQIMGVDEDEALMAAGFMPTPGIPELTRELDSDTAEMIHFYEGLSPSSRSISKTMIQQLREVERSASIGGGLPPEKEVGS